MMKIRSDKYINGNTAVIAETTEYGNILLTKNFLREQFLDTRLAYLNEANVPREILARIERGGFFKREGIVKVTSEGSYELVKFNSQFIKKGEALWLPIF